MPEVLAGVKHHMPTVSDALKDPDVSIRKKAMDLLFTMCDASNASSLVGDLLAYLVRLSNVPGQEKGGTTESSDQSWDIFILRGRERKGGCPTC